MNYPSTYISALADFAEKREKDTYEDVASYRSKIGIPAHYRIPERIEHVADVVERIEEPFETRLDWIYERLTAYRRLQELWRELELIEKDRAALVNAYRALAKVYRQRTGEVPPAPSDASVRAFQRVKHEEVMKGVRRVLADLRYKSRG